MTSKYLEWNVHLNTKMWWLLLQTVKVLRVHIHLQDFFLLHLSTDKSTVYVHHTIIIQIHTFSCVKENLDTNSAYLILLIEWQSSNSLLWCISDGHRNIIHQVSGSLLLYILLKSVIDPIQFSSTSWYVDLSTQIWMIGLNCLYL